MHVYRVGLWLVVTSLILVHAPVQAEWVALEARYQLHPLRTATAEVIGGGSYTGEAHWIAVEPETLNQGLWEAACGKR